MIQLNPKQKNSLINFGNITRFINEGILEPLKLLPEATEIQALAASVEALTQVFDGLSGALTALAEATAKMGETDLENMDLEGVKKALTSLAGMGPTLATGTAGGAAGGAMKKEPVEEFAALAEGGTFIARKPTAMLVGEKGAERVIVSPLKEAEVEALKGQEEASPQEIVLSTALGKKGAAGPAGKAMEKAMSQGGTAGGAVGAPTREMIDSMGIEAVEESQRAHEKIAGYQAKAAHINDKIMKQMYSEGVNRQSEAMKSRANEARSETLHNVTKTKDHLDKSLGMMKGGMTGFFDSIGGFFKNLSDNFFGAFSGDDAQKAMHAAEQNAMAEAKASGDLRDIKIANAAEEAKGNQGVVKAQKAAQAATKEKELTLDKGLAAERAAAEAAARAATDEEKTGMAGVGSMAAKRGPLQDPQAAVQNAANIQAEQSRLSTVEASRALRGGGGNEHLADLQAQYRAPRTGYKLKQHAGFGEAPKDNFLKWDKDLTPEERKNVDVNNIWESNLPRERKMEIARMMGKGGQVGGQPISEWTDATANLQEGQRVSPEQYFADQRHGVFSRSGNTRISAQAFDAAMQTGPGNMTPDVGAQQAMRRAAGQPVMNLSAANHEQFGQKYDRYDPGLAGRAAQYERPPVDPLDYWGKGDNPNQQWAKRGGMAAGGSFIAAGPTPLMVGEKGPERVTVTPSTSMGIPDLEDKAGAMAAAAASNAVAAIAALPSASKVDDTGNVAEPQVTSAPLTDVYDRMHQEQVGTDAGTTKLQSSELSSIEAASTQQVDHLATINETLEAIKALLTPNPGSSLSGRSPQQLQGSTAPNTTSYGSTDYGKWQFGRHAGNAANQVINDGTA